MLTKRRPMHSLDVGLADTCLKLVKDLYTQCRWPRRVANDLRIGSKPLTLNAKHGIEIVL